MEQQPAIVQVAQQEPAHQEEGQMDSVLLVDPDAAMQQQVQQTLHGVFVVRLARTAAAALEAIDRQRPDLLISEVDLPDMSGLKLCEQLRAQSATAGLPILFLTTRAGIGEKVAGFMAGADDYVVKPIDPRYFGPRLRLLLRLKALDQKSSLPGSASPPHPPSTPPTRPGGFGTD